MCGICGIYEYDHKGKIDPGLLDGMLKVIQHRGPDDQGVYLTDFVGLGNRRLSIIDLTSGKQPIYNEDGSVVIVFNGEIYNYRDLTRRLIQNGHIFTTASDTEAVVHLYEEMAEGCVHELRGMFAFALWDIRRQRLFLARDRLGIKPLYYTHADGRLVFGSEIKAILQHPSVQARPDLEAFTNYLTLKYVPAPQTMFEGVFALPPGYFMTCDSTGIQVGPYWDLSFSAGGEHRATEAEYAEQLEALLRESVNIHLMSDVPFGAFLSGGIDSSTVVALMSQFLNEPVKTFSVGFEGDGQTVSELPYARLVAQQYQTDHHEVVLTPQHLIDLSEKVVWHLDQPVADEASLPNYMVAELASHHVKMVLTGEGGDELFAGYARYAGERFAPLFTKIPHPMRAGILKAADVVPGLRRPKLALYALCQPDEISRLVNWFPLLNRDMQAAIISEDLKRLTNGGSAEKVFANLLKQAGTTHPLNRMLYIDTKIWLPDDLLARGDKTSMAASIEARVPLLDHKLVEFAAALPPDLKLKGLARKYLLKKVSQSWLPEAIINRKKKGFPVPFSIWYRKEAREFVHDILSKTSLRQRGLYNVEQVARLIDEHEKGLADHGSIIYGLLSVELWYRLFIDSRVSVTR